MTTRSDARPAAGRVQASGVARHLHTPSNRSPAHSANLRALPVSHSGWYSQGVGSLGGRITGTQRLVSWHSLCSLPRR